MQKQAITIKTNFDNLATQLEIGKLCNNVIILR